MQKIVLMALFLFVFPVFAKQTILVGVDHAPPYSSVEDDGSSSGLILDLINALPDASEFVIQPVACPFSRCVRMLAQGEIDVMGGLIETQERQRVMSFVKPPYMVLQSSFVFYKRSDRALRIESYSDLYNKRIAVMRGGVYFPRFDEDRELNKVLVTSEKTAIDLLLKDRVDLVIAVEETADHSMSILNQPSHQLEKVDYRFTQEIYGNMALSLKFANSQSGQKVREGMLHLAKSNQLSQLVASYQLPPIPAHLIVTQ